MDRDQLTDALIQLGFDKAAGLLAALLTSDDADAGADGYRDGIEDALNTLIQAGATDPR